MQCAGDKVKSKIDVFIEQLTDSLIVGGISGISAYLAAGENTGLNVLEIAFGLTFLLKMKEYRKINMPQQQQTIHSEKDQDGK